MWSEPLPAELGYLATVIDRLDSIESELLNEDNEYAGSLVENALRGRVRGLTPDEADRRLDEDSETLARWLDQPGLEDSAAQFVNGFFLGALGRDFLGEAPEFAQPALPSVEMDAPRGFNLIDDRGVLHLKSATAEIVINPLDPELVDPATLMGGNIVALRSAFPGMPPIEDTDISIGNITGKKRLSVVKRHSFFKSVTYVLQVPGGWVQVSVRGQTTSMKQLLNHGFQL